MKDWMKYVYGETFHMNVQKPGIKAKKRNVSKSKPKNRVDNNRKNTY